MEKALNFGCKMWNVICSHRHTSHFELQQPLSRYTGSRLKAKQHDDDDEDLLALTSRVPLNCVNKLRHKCGMLYSFLKFSNFYNSTTPSETRYAQFHLCVLCVCIEQLSINYPFICFPFFKSLNGNLCKPCDELSFHCSALLNMLRHDIKWRDYKGEHKTGVCCMLNGSGGKYLMFNRVLDKLVRQK